MMFFDLLWYLKTNEFIRDGSWIDLTTVDPKFSGLQIKFFQNGKVQMKGLSTEDWDKIIHLDEICSRK